MSDLTRRHDVPGPTFGAVGLAVAALLALPAVAGAAETPGRPVAAIHSTQTCSRPSTCETDAASRAQALTARRVGSEGLDRDNRRLAVAAPNPAGEALDWGDAGVGAGAGFGLALVGGGGALAIRRRGRTRRADR